MARKRKSKPTSSRRAEKQQVRDRLAHAQDDAQRLGVIRTLPEEALKPARVDPSSQSEQPLPGLIGQAIRKGWATPDDRKPRLVDELTNIVQDEEAPPVVKVMAFNALRAGDKDQWERDHPEESGKSKGGVHVNQQVAVGIDWDKLTGAAPQDDPVEAKMRALDEQEAAGQEKAGSGETQGGSDDSRQQPAPEGRFDAGGSEGSDGTITI